MALYSTRLYADPCAEEAWDRRNDASYDYVMNIKPHMRTDTDKCRASLGTTCSFYGPLNTMRARQASFMEGRGALSSECPECEVTVLPDSVFPPTPAPSACQNTDMTPQLTRVSRACNDLSETDTTLYAWSPGAFQEGYTGYQWPAFNQSRDLTLAAYNAQIVDSCPAGTPRTSYGIYPPESAPTYA